MLSPNATKRVEAMRGGAVSVTVNEHCAVTLLASVAVHVTFFEPIGKTLSFGGVQLTCTGAVPPDVDGWSKWTKMSPPVLDCCVREVGQVICSAAGGGGGGCAGAVGELVQPPALTRKNKATVRRSKIGIASQ